VESWREKKHKENGVQRCYCRVRVDTCTQKVEKKIKGSKGTSVGINDICSFFFFFFLFPFPFPALYKVERSTTCSHPVVSPFLLTSAGTGLTSPRCAKPPLIDLSFLPFDSIDIQCELERYTTHFNPQLSNILSKYQQHHLFSGLQPYNSLLTLRQGSPVSLPRLGIYYGARWLQAASFFYLPYLSED